MDASLNSFVRDIAVPANQARTFGLPQNNDPTSVVYVFVNGISFVMYYPEPANLMNQHLVTVIFKLFFIRSMFKVFALHFHAETF